GIPRDFER
ncbi:unnamed protein product, partial [Allacma fusca]